MREKVYQKIIIYELEKLNYSYKIQAKQGHGQAVISVGTKKCFRPLPEYLKSRRKLTPVKDLFKMIIQNERLPQQFQNGYQKNGIIADGIRRYNT